MRRTGRPPVPAEIWVRVAAAFLIALGYGLGAPILPPVNGDQFLCPPCRMWARPLPAIR